MLQGFISPNMDHMLSHALLDNNIPPSQMWCFPESSAAMEAILSQASLGLCNISPSDYQTLAHFGVLYPAIDEGMDESGCMIRKPTDWPSKTVTCSSLGSVDHMPPGVSHSSKPKNMLSLAFENSKEQTGICSISAKRRSWQEALSNSLETLLDKQELASLKLNIEEDMSPLTLNAPVFANDPKSTVPSLALPCNITEDTSQEYPPYSLESPSMGTDCHIVEPFTSSKLVNHMQDGVNPNLSTDHVSCMGKKLNGDMMQGFAADWRENFRLYGNKCLSNQSKDDVMSGHEYISHSSSTLVKSIKKEDDNRQLHENGTMDIKDVMASMSGSDQSRKRHAVAANLPSSTPYSKRAHLQPIAPALLMSTGLAATTTTSTTTAGTASTTTRSSKSSSRTRQGPALNTNGKPRAQQGSANDPQSVAARNRRERINARLKVLQELVPDGSKVDLVTMLEKAINYVKCLQLQLRVLSNDDYWQAMNQENDTVDHEHGGTAAKTRSEEGQSTTHHQAPKKADEEQYNNYCTYP